MSVYLVRWYDLRLRETHVYGIYGTAEKAESEKRTLEELNPYHCVWVSEEVVQ